jgi:sugar O-acyltransferase (sialic acid O-acetyltransferase NeuD family)
VTIQRLFVYGAGGHGTVIGDILIVRKEPSFAGFIDDRFELHGRSILGFPVWGDGSWLAREVKNGRVAVALGVADNPARQKMALNCLDWGAELATVVHPAASISSSARLGSGTSVMAHAVVNPNAEVGMGVIVNTAAVIEHDVKVGDFAHISPNAAMGGVSRIGALSHLGIGAVVIHCVSIGARAIVGAGAVVVRDIPDNVVAFGVPARIRRSHDLDGSQHNALGRTHND